MVHDWFIPEPPADHPADLDPPRAPRLPVFGPAVAPNAESPPPSRWRWRRAFSHDASAAAACAAHGHNSPLQHALAGCRGAEAPAACFDLPDLDPRGEGFTSCQWIDGDLHEETARFCTAPTTDGQAWCPEHFRRVYLPAASQEAQREMARFHIIANNRKMGRDTPYYVDREFESAYGTATPKNGAGRTHIKAAP